MLVFKFLIEYMFIAQYKFYSTIDHKDIESNCLSFVHIYLLVK